MDIVTRLRTPSRGWHPDQLDAADEIERLRADVETYVKAASELERDAARYRKWREVYCGQGPYDLLSALADAWEPGQVDTAIDAAMKG